MCAGKLLYLSPKPKTSFTFPAEQPVEKASESLCGEASPEWVPSILLLVNNLYQTCFSDVEWNRYTLSREEKEELKEKNICLLISSSIANAEKGV